VSNGHYEHTSRSGHADAIGHHEHTVWTRVRKVRATKYIAMAGMLSTSGWLELMGTFGYVNAAGNAEHIRMAGVTGHAGQGGQAGATRQHASDGRYERTICRGVNAMLDMAGIADGAYGVARQTGTALGHAGTVRANVGSAELYPIVGFEQDSNTSEVMYSTHPGQYQLSWQLTGLLPPVSMATDPVCVPS